ncbi:MAG: glycosyltransferase family 9 protein [Candidatus Loosdrechtia sp.]|uniref:glycosyltransferase family 9 protein n=1 Tax=Candidatus Loosdrechtia sp. TaxID=3101272 RepID=UPI003A5E651B|nr:MAG: glycosyltransferase family 9 protein [Candidatus Jettenia sp. AMX2]
MQEKDPRYNTADIRTSSLSPFFNAPLQKYVLMIRPGALGDVIVTLPTFSAIRRYFQGSHIEVMGSTSFLEIVKGRFYADTISRFDQADMAAFFVKDIQISETIKKRFSAMDVIISFAMDKEHIMITRLETTGARHVIQYSPFPPDGERIHITDHFLKFLDLLGIPYDSKIPELFLQKEDRLFADNFIKDRVDTSKRLLVAVHPGSGGQKKCWPVKRFAGLISRLEEEMDACVFVISGPADNEIIERLRGEIRKDLIMVERLSIPCLAAVIKQCNLFIGNDSGVTHLAAATGTDTIAIFGPTDPVIWGPRGEQIEILYHRLPCSPCLPDKRKNCTLQACLENITVDDVIQKIRLHHG